MELIGKFLGLFVATAIWGGFVWIFTNVVFFIEGWEYFPRCFGCGFLGLIGLTIIRNTVRQIGAHK